MKKKISIRNWLGFIIVGFAGQIARAIENMYLNKFLFYLSGDNYLDFVPITVAASAITACVTTILIGSLSDRIGRRKIFIVVGYILWGISTAAFGLISIDNMSYLFPVANAAFISGVMVIVLDCVMTFFGSSANDAAFNSYVTRNVEKENRGKVEGVLSVLPLFAMLVIFVGLNGLTDGENARWDLFFYIVGGIVLVVGILAIFLLKETDKEKSKDNIFKIIAEGFEIKTIKNNGILYLVFIAYLIYGIATQVFFPYLMIYFEYNLSFSGMDFSIVLGVVLIVGSIISVLYGILSDKFNKFVMAIPVTILFIIGLILVYFVNPGNLVFAIIAGTIMMFGYISLSSVLNSIVRDYIPHGKEGAFMGIRMIFVVMLPMCTGPYIGSALSSALSTNYYTDFDGVDKLLPTSYVWIVAALILLLIFIPLLIAYFKDKNDRFNKNHALIYEGGKHQEEVPLKENPNINFKRNSYLSLNGEWEVTINKSDELNCEYSEKIIVPYAIESPLSGIGRGLNPNEFIHYRKVVTLPPNFKKDRLVLHFDGIDNRSKLYINGQFIVDHNSGYIPLEVDISPFVKGDSFTIELVVSDKTDLDYLTRGKQALNRGGIWYTSTSGIYKPVYLESTPDKFIQSIKITPLFDEKAIEVLVKTNVNGPVKLNFLNKNILIEANKKVTISDLDMPVWDFLSPNLIDVVVSFFDDSVETYFGNRKIEIKGNDIYLNNRKVVLNGLLYQGYFYKGGLTPSSYSDYEEDVSNMKDLGFNCVRVHIKEELPAFYYYCDAHGLLVIQDIPNGGSRYKVLTTILGALPKDIRKDDSNYKTFSRTDLEGRTEYKAVRDSILNRLYNHPSVVMYTLFNEGWGQFDTLENYKEARKIDTTRIYDNNSGWYDNDFNEIKSIHNYFFKLKLPKNVQKPVILSEFGGYSYIENERFYGTKEFGYRKYKDVQKLEEDYKKLYEEHIIPLICEGLSGCIYTEYNDIEDETNGLYTYDRKLKLDKELIQEINRKINKLY